MKTESKAELNTLKKQAINRVKWKDLRHLTRGQIVYNVILPYPFLIMSWWFASQSLFVFACLSTFLFFASAFRQAHDGYHHSLGVSKAMTTVLLLIMSVFLLTSLHTIKMTHLKHHRSPLSEDDVEGSLASLTWWQALIGGVRYRLAIYREGYRLSNRRNRIKAIVEFALIAVAITSSLLLILAISMPPLIGSALKGFEAVDTLIETGNAYAYLSIIAKVASYHLIVMFLANASVGLAAVWGVHHDAEDTIARTERNRLVNILTFGLLYHTEHHIFPSVPTNNLPKLAQRLDTTLPEITRKQVIPNTKQINKYVTHTLATVIKKYSRNNNNCPIRKFMTL